MATAALKLSGAPAPLNTQRPRHIKKGVDPYLFLKLPIEFKVLATTRKDDDGELRPMLSGALQFSLIFWILQRTVGEIDRPQWSTITLGQFADLCGSDPKNVSDALTDLETRGIIESRSERYIPDPKTCDGIEVKNSRRQYRLTWDQWENAPGYKAPARQTVAKKVSEAEPTPERTVKPGAQSKLTVNVMAEKDAEPMPLKVIYKSQLEHPITFRAETSAPGTLHLTAFSNPLKTAMVQGPKRDEANKEVNEIEREIRDLSLDYFRSLPAPIKLGNVAAAMNGVPVGYLRTQLKQKFPTGRARPQDRPGLMLNLAEEAARVWSAECEREQEAAADRRQQEAAATMPANDAESTLEPLDPAKPWDQVRERLKTSITPEAYFNWFAQTRQLAADENSVTVLVRDQFTLDIITTDYAGVLTKVSKEANVRLIVWRVEG